MAAPPPAEPPSFIPVPKHLLTRCLFSNPCCALISSNASTDSAPLNFNVMTISWLTPADNHTLFILSLNARRHTLQNLLSRPAFTLCPYVEGMEATALATGGCSGADPLVAARGKLEGLGVPLCALGGGGGGGGGGSPPALASSPAHLACRVLGRLDLAAPAGGGGAEGGAATEAQAGGGGALRGHVALLCEVLAGWARPGYWAGTTLRAGEGLPRLLSFCGSGIFAPVG